MWWKNMVPSYLRKPFWLVPSCILSLTVGLHMISILVGFNPYSLDRLEARGLVPLAAVCGILCVVLPILLLWISVQEDRDEADGGMED